MPGGKNDWARQAVFFTLLNPFANDPEEEPHFFITLFLKRYSTKHIGNAIKMRVLDGLSRAQDQGSRFCRTKSFAVVTYATLCQETALIV